MPARDRQILDWWQEGIAWLEIARRLKVDNVDSLRKQQRVVARMAWEIDPESAAARPRSTD
jgi:hypothetical protein